MEGPPLKKGDEGGFLKCRHIITKTEILIYAGF
jgi:hypothetical protein